MTVNVKWNGPFFSTFSLGEVCRNYVLALDELGVAVRIRSIREIRPGGFDIGEDIRRRLIALKRKTIPSPFVNVTFEFPIFAVNDRLADKNVAFFPIDWDRCPGQWAEAANWCDEYWVPSHFNYVCAAKSGFDPHKLFIIPHGVDTNRFKPGNPTLDLPNEGYFTFLTISNYISRKAWDVLIKAYTREFSDDDKVCLVCKTADPHGLMQAAAPYIQQRGAPKVYLLHRELDLDQIPCLYSSADCFVLPSRAEGFGMCFLEAMAAGIPAIGTRYSGNMHYMDDKNSLLVDVLELRPDQSDGSTGLTLNTAEPDIGDLQKKLRWVFENRNLAKQLGLQGRATAERFTWSKQAELIRDRCLDLLGGPKVPMWRSVLSGETKVRLFGKEPLLDVFILTNGNDYLLARALHRWSEVDISHRITIIETCPCASDPEFLREAMKRGLIDANYQTDGFSIENILSENTNKSAAPFIHISAFDRAPMDRSGISNALELLLSDPSLAAIGGYVVSPSRTIILGPFKNNEACLDPAFLGKGITSRIVADRLKRAESNYIHFQAAILRRSAFDQVVSGLPDVPDIQMSFALSKELKALGMGLVTIPSFLIESEEFPGSPFTANSDGGKTFEHFLE
jgi:glycosyltransferase involved in cell wall biosynthesis